MKAVKDARCDSSFSFYKTLPRFAGLVGYCAPFTFPMTNTNHSSSPTPNPKLSRANTLPRLRLVAILEGISFLVLLFIAMPLKYFYQQPEMVQKVGMLHGWLFVLYVVLLLLAHYQFKWEWKKTALGFILSLLPFGTFYAERKMFRE
jgi:integral membrane protein